MNNISKVESVASTPTPWKTEIWDLEGTLVVTGFTDEHRGVVCVAELADRTCTPQEQQANATLIVKAVNSHSDLVEACKAALANLKPIYVSEHHVMKLITAALEKAGEPLSHPYHNRRDELCGLCDGTHEHTHP